jgi:hypothetical protein
VSRTGRAALAGLVTLALAGAVAVTGCGGDDQPSSAGADAFTEVSKQPRLTRTARRAAPRWQVVTRLTGDAPATESVTIVPGAIQWRARWRCESGEIALAVEPKPRSAAERSGGRCPGSGDATWVQTGEQRLRVTASGRWSVVVEQQIDTPIDEPPLAAMQSSRARVLASGSFFDVERTGSGEVRLYRLGDGRLALRMDPFRTSSNTDLFVWLSTARRPKTTAQGVRAQRLGRLIPLKSTIGPQNYVLGRGIDPRRIRSILIWCEPIQIVYTAAALEHSASAR